MIYSVKARIFLSITCPLSAGDYSDFEHDKKYKSVLISVKKINNANEIWEKLAYPEEDINWKTKLDNRLSQLKSNKGVHRNDKPLHNHEMTTKDPFDISDIHPKCYFQIFEKIQEYIPGSTTNIFNFYDVAPYKKEIEFRKKKILRMATIRSKSNIISQLRRQDTVLPYLFRTRLMGNNY